MDEKELISQLQALKQIKPRQNWVLLAKQHILQERIPLREILKTKCQRINILGVLFQKRIAYMLALCLILFLGWGIMTFIPQNGEVAEKSPDSLAVTEVKGNVEVLKTKSKALSKLAKSGSPESIPMVVEEIKVVVEGIIEKLQKDPELAREVALEINNNKTYLDTEGEESNVELRGTLEIFYKSTVEQLVKDFENITLTESQENSFMRIKNSLEGGNYEGRYDDALEDILLFSMALESKK